MGGLGCCKSSKRSISRELFILAGDLKEARILDLMMLSNAIYSNMVIFNTETATAIHTACVAYFRETFFWFLTWKPNSKKKENYQILGRHSCDGYVVIGFNSLEFVRIQNPSWFRSWWCTLQKNVPYHKCQLKRDFFTAFDRLSLLLRHLFAAKMQVTF